MDSENVALDKAARQDNSNPLQILIDDLSALRRKMLATERRRRSAVLAGELLILARQYQNKPPSRKTLKRFFHFIVREERAA